MNKGLGILSCQLMLRVHLGLVNWMQAPFSTPSWDNWFRMTWRLIQCVVSPECGHLICWNTLWEVSVSVDSVLEESTCSEKTRSFAELLLKKTFTFFVKYGKEHPFLFPVLILPSCNLVTLLWRSPGGSLRWELGGEVTPKPPHTGPCTLQHHA